MQLEKTFFVTNEVFSVQLATHLQTRKVGDNKIIHDLIVLIYLESLQCEIKMIIQFSYLGNLVEHHTNLYNCSDFSSSFSINSIKYASTWRVPQGFEFLIGLYVSTEISNSFIVLFFKITKLHSPL